jgi:hypothetical protein
MKVPPYKGWFFINTFTCNIKTGEIHVRIK